jgi:hypothetical protein
MEVLGNSTLAKQGLRLVLASINSKTGKTELVTMSWADWNHCFFITTMCRIGEGKTITRKRLRQLNKSGRAQPDKVIIDVDVPKAIEMLQGCRHHRPAQQDPRC